MYYAIIRYVPDEVVGLGFTMEQDLLAKLKLIPV
jgi:hypothetical protein